MASLDEAYPNTIIDKRSASLDGANPKALLEDDLGRLWLYKPQNLELTLVDVAASHVARACGVASPVVYALDTYFQGEHLQGSIQPMLDVQPIKLSRDLHELNAGQLQQLQEHQVVDWLLGNIDAHRSQFLILVDDILVGIDKSQALRIFPWDRLDWDFNYKPFNTRLPVYYYLAKAVRGGRIPRPQMPFVYVQRVRAHLDDEWLRLNWEPIVSKWPWYRLIYAAPLAWLRRGAFVHAILEKIVQRKNDLETDFTRLYRRL